MPEGSYRIRNTLADFFYVNSSLNKAMIVPSASLKRYDRRVAGSFKQTAEEFIRRTPADEIYLDMRPVRFIDSEAIKSLESLGRYAETTGRKLKIAVSPEVDELLDVSDNKPHLPLCSGIPYELYLEAGRLASL